MPTIIDNTNPTLTTNYFLDPVKIQFQEKPHQLSAVQNKDYDYQKNAARLYDRALSAPSFDRTYSEMAYLEKYTYADRNIFMVHGAHHNPKHISNMEKVFSKESLAAAFALNKSTPSSCLVPSCLTGFFQKSNTAEQNKAENTAKQWLFLIEGITKNSVYYSPYAEIEYAAQSAQAWQIPAENIIPYYNDHEVLAELASAVGTEKAMFFLVMYGMQTGDIKYTAGQGYDENEIRQVFIGYIQLCKGKNIPFDIDKLNALFPISNEKYAQAAQECWDLHLEIRNKIAEENLQEILKRYPDAKNILVYCGSDHTSVFKPK